MTHAQAIAYLITALGMLSPAAYGAQRTVDLLAPDLSHLSTVQKRGVAIGLGIVYLVALANGITLSGITPVPFDPWALIFDVIAGVAAGFAAIGDFHFAQALREEAKGNTVTALQDLAADPTVQALIAPSPAPTTPPTA